MDAFKNKENKIISINLAKKIVGILFVTFLFNFFFFAAPALASVSNNIDINNTDSYYGVINPADDELYITSDNSTEDYTIKEDQSQIEYNSFNPEGIVEHLPENGIKKPEPIKISPIPAKSTGIRMVLMTAYNSEVAQTDNSPCTTATGFNVCKHGIEDTIAANFLSFGTKVKIPALYGDKIFIVRDRMNKRHANKVDIWMTSRTKALQFGVKYAKIEIVP
jgi:3D (Asp-Asp-Asp) domain-containing protein